MTPKTDRDWAEPATFDAEPGSEPADGWIWHRPERTVEGRAWGGNPEILSWLLMADREIERDTAQQREAVLRAPATYAPRTMAVFDVDLGHTDPQLVILYGGLVRVDGPARRITVTY